MKRAIYRIWLVAAVMALSLMGSDDGRLWAQGAPKTPAVVELPNEVDPLTVVGRITVVEPQDYQVFQRFYGTQGTIRLRGTAHALLKLQYRLIGPAADGKALDGEWHDVEVSPSKGEPLKADWEVPM